MREVVVSGFKSLRTVNLTSKTKNVAEDPIENSDVVNCVVNDVVYEVVYNVGIFNRVDE